jgi:hypothetical protein
LNIRNIKAEEGNFGISKINYIFKAFWSSLTFEVENEACIMISIATFSIMTLGIMTFSIMALGIKTLSTTINKI